MVGRERFNTKKYLAVGMLTFLIFSLGVTIGIVLNYERYRWAEYENQLQDVNYRSLQLQSLFLSTLEHDEESCSVLVTTLGQSVVDLGESLNDVLTWEKDVSLSKKDFTLLKRKYTIDNIRYWLFAQKNKEVCDTNLATILYFYSGEQCDICPNQGVVLTYYKKIFGEELLIFPIDTDLAEDELMVEFLVSQYNVTSPSEPTLVIDDKRFEGVLDKEELGIHICGAFPEDHPQCGFAAPSNESES